MRRATAEVLAREEYADLRPGLLDRVWSGILDMAGRLLDLLQQTGQAGLIGSLVLTAALVLLVLAAVRMLRRVRRSPRVAESPVGLAGRSGEDWAQEAEAHAAAGRWREAVRCHHRALVADLAAAGLVDEVPGRTATEYEADAVTSVPRASDDMGRATRLFEQAWYAKTPVGADELGELHQAAEQVRRAAGLRVPAGRP